MAIAYVRGEADSPTDHSWHGLSPFFLISFERTTSSGSEPTGGLLIDTNRYRSELPDSVV